MYIHWDKKKKSISVYKKYHKNKYICTMYTKNYALKYTIHNHCIYIYIITIINFFKNIIFFCLCNYKMVQENIWFHKNDDESYDMIDLYRDDIRVLDIKILTITMILMLEKYY